MRLRIGYCISNDDGLAASCLCLSQTGNLSPYLAKCREIRVGHPRHRAGTKCLYRGPSVVFESPCVVIERPDKRTCREATQPIARDVLLRKPKAFHAFKEIFCTEVH